MLENWPILVMTVMMGALFVTRGSMATICSVGALAVLVLSGNDGGNVVAQAAPSAVLVLVVMTAVQLAVHFILDAGAGDWMALVVARMAAHRWLRRVPAAVLLPCILVPAAMGAAAVLHNITAVLILAPIAIAICTRYEVDPKAILSGILVASNLGGASMAWGDTPAIIQRSFWHFSPATFAQAMLPRNVLLLFMLTLLVCVLTWRQSRQTVSWLELLKRLQVRDDYELVNHYTPVRPKDLAIGVGSLVGFLGLQFIFPQHSLVTGSLLLGVLVLLRPEKQRVASYTILGIEAILVIVSIFTVASAVQGTPWVQQITEHLRDHGTAGVVELASFALTALVSADGAAATLAPVVHQAGQGSMLSAWQLASGICAGSSALITAASAGPVLNAVSRAEGNELSFRDYAKFGLPFSTAMLAIYLLYNAIVGG